MSVLVNVVNVFKDVSIKDAQRHVDARLFAHTSANPSARLLVHLVEKIVRQLVHTVNAVINAANCVCLVNIAVNGNASILSAAVSVEKCVTGHDVMNLASVLSQVIM